MAIEFVYQSCESCPDWDAMNFHYWRRIPVIRETPTRVYIANQKVIEAAKQYEEYNREHPNNPISDYGRIKPYRILNKKKLINGDCINHSFYYLKEPTDEPILDENESVGVISLNGWAELNPKVVSKVRQTERK